MKINWYSIGSRVREKRCELGISQEDLAEYAQLSNVYISRIENGTANPTISVLFRISHALDTSISYLLEGVNNPYVNQYNPVVREQDN